MGDGREKIFEKSAMKIPAVQAVSKFVRVRLKVFFTRTVIRFFDSYIRKQIAKTLKNRVFFIKKQIFFNLCIE